MDETANPRGCKLKIGNKESPRSPGYFWKRIAECRHCKSPLGPFPPLMGGRKILQEQKGAYGPHSHKIILDYLFVLVT